MTEGSPWDLPIVTIDWVAGGFRVPVSGRDYTYLFR